VRKFSLIDADHATKSSRKRLIGMRPSDISAKTAKVVIAERMIREIEPDAYVGAHLRAALLIVPSSP
jgi:hypothetical protein